MTIDTTRMNPEVKAKWIDALTSGEYSQTKRCLRDKNGYCCLGVLTDLYIKETGQGKWVPGIAYTAGAKTPDDGVQSFTTMMTATTAEDAFKQQWIETTELADGVIPESIQQWAGFHDGDSAGSARDHMGHLMQMNDGRDGNEYDDVVPSKSFAEIAEYIKENL